MKKSITGTYYSGRDEKGTFQAFVPYPLQKLKALKLNAHHYQLIEQANRVLGKLDGIAQVLPDLQLFLYFYVRKEALLSSQIEGTQSSLSDFLLSESHEIPGIPLDDVVEVSNYVQSLEYGLQRLDQLPLSLRFIRELHEILLQKGRGSQQSPGQFRIVQNWIGGRHPSTAVFVPTPVDKLSKCLHDLEQFFHMDSSYSPLIKTALIHYQFETIHPFLDGNGRIGRLLIILSLLHEQIIEHPILYLSLYFKQNRNLYYQHLMDVRTKGHWLEWIAFFLEGIIEVGNQSIDSAKRILALFAQDMERIRSLSQAGVLEIYLFFQKHPISMASDIVKHVSISKPSTYRVLKVLCEEGMLQEISGKQRGKVYVYRQYFDILNEGTEPLSS